MFGSYSVINVIVLLNLLIAMMSNSYAMIDVSKWWSTESILNTDDLNFRVSGTLGHGMEICSNQIMDELFWRRRNFAAAIQHFAVRQMGYAFLQEKNTKTNSTRIDYSEQYLSEYNYESIHNQMFYFPQFLASQGRPR